MKPAASAAVANINIKNRAFEPGFFTPAFFAEVELDPP